MAYNVGEAYLQINVSFKGVAQAIDAEAKKWGVSSGQSYSGTFSGTVSQKMRDMQVGPSASSSAKQGGDTGGKFADSFKARVDAALKSLPDVKIGADSTDAERDIAELRAVLQELSGKRIGIDIDEAEAIAELDEIKAELDEVGARSPSVAVKIDTAAASAKLAEIQAEVSALSAEDADIDVDVDDHGSMGAAASGAESLSSGISGIGIAIALVVPMIGPLAAALAGLAAGAAASLGAVAAGGAVAYLGLSGVSKASQLLTQQQQAQVAASKSVSKSMGGEASSAAALQQAEASLANAKANAADAAIASAERVKNAEQSLADAREQADRQAQQSAQQVADAKQAVAQASQQAAAQQAQDARAVVSAEQDLADAARSSAQAQQSLNDAREQAVRDLQSYADNAVDANLGLQQSQIDLVNAQQQYQKDQANPSVTPLQLQQDALNVAKAQQAIVEAQQRLQNATEDNNKAQQAGVDGAPGVISAQAQIQSAAERQQQAVQNLADAQSKQQADAVSGAAAVAKAKQAEAKAVADAAYSQQQSAEQVAKAEQGVTDAIRAQQQQARQSAFSIQSARAGVASARRSGGGGSVSVPAAQSNLADINAQIAKVDPATLAFAKFVQGTLTPALDKLKAAAAGALLPGLQKGFEDLMPAMKPLTGFISVLAGTIGDLFDRFAVGMRAPAFQQFFKYMEASAPTILQQVFRIVMNLGAAFANFMTAMAPVTNAIGNVLGDLTQKLANTNAFQKLSDWLMKNGPVIFNFFAGLGKLIGTLVVDFAPLGIVIMKVIAGFSAFLASLNPDIIFIIVAALGALVAAFAGPVAAVIGLAAAVAGAAALVVRHWDTIRNAFSAALDWVVGFFKQHWQLILTILTGPIGLAVAEVIKHWSSIRSAFSTAVDWVTRVWSAGWSAIKNYLVNPIRDAYNSVVGFFGPNGSIVRTFDSVKTWVTGKFSSAWSAVKSVFTKPITDAASTITTGFDKVVTFISGLPERISRAASGMWDGIKTAFRSVINTVIGWWNNFHLSLHIPSNAVTKFLHLDGIGFTINTPDIPYLATGGLISGPGTGTSDSITARVSNGEYVVNAAATRRHLSLLEAINGRRPPQLFDSGGVLPPGLTAALNNTGVPEAILTLPQLASVAGIGAAGRPTITQTNNIYYPQGVPPAIEINRNLQEALVMAGSR